MNFEQYTPTSFQRKSRANLYIDTAFYAKYGSCYSK